MSWRERIAAARERGGFAPEDYSRIGNFNTCFVGEQHEKGVIPKLWVESTIPWEEWAVSELYVEGTYAMEPVMANDFDTAEKFLDWIEDAALRYKREHVNKEAV